MSESLDAHMTTLGRITASTGTVTLGNGKLLRDENPFRYASYYYDKDLSFYYLNARYYNPAWGRFITRDAVDDGINRYVYCRNNPVNYVDPSGRWTVAIGDELSAAFGLYIAAGKQYVLDGYGNVGVITYGSIGGGFPDVNYGKTITVTNADNIDDLNELSGGAGLSILFLGADISFAVTKDARNVTAVQGQLGVIPGAEMHGSVTWSKVKKIRNKAEASKVIKSLPITKQLMAQTPVDKGVRKSSKGRYKV